VPFFLRTGKRLPERRTQIVIQFKSVPYSIFGGRRRTIWWPTAWSSTCSPTRTSACR
jgi:glucose-6-phosphate 1-dehydrogenase